jgi:hypothetical protein
VKWNEAGRPALGGILRIVVLTAFTYGIVTPCFAQNKPAPRLETFFRDDIGLSEEQVAAISSGTAIAQTLHSRQADEIFVFGAVYVNATPKAYLEFARDFDYLRKLPGYLAIDAFSNPPQLSDLKQFTFDQEEFKELKNCKAGNCEIQMPASSIDELHSTVDFSAPDAEERLSQILKVTLLERLAAYQKEGNEALGVYNDKRNPTEVPAQFNYMLSYSKALPRYLPDFYNYLLAYPKGNPGMVEDTFYWSKVKFGLKPTLRVVHVLTARGKSADEPVYTIAEKQLYSSHYFQTALDLTFCISGSGDPNAKGFYLVRVMGSEQAGLTGFKGSIVRKVAMDRSASSLQKSLIVIKNTLESKPQP